MSGETFLINVVLHSEELDSTQNEIVRLLAAPATFQEIREKVEDSFSIPACVQTLWVQDCEIKDPANTTTASFYFQNNDKIKVTYPSKGECTKVKDMVKWLGDCCTVLDEIRSSQTELDIKSLTPQFNDIVFNRHNLSTLSLCLFTPTSDKVKKMNIFHFDSLKGTELLVRLHESFIFIQKSDLFKSLHSRMDMMEMTCCVAFTLLSKFESIRKRVINCGGLNTCIETFLRSDAESYMDYTKFSLFAICNISDMSDAQLYISKQQSVIQQVLKIVSLSTLAIRDSLVALSLLLNLAECREAHVYLFQQDVVEQIMESVKAKRELSPSEDQSIELKVFIYYTGLLLSQMIAGGEVPLDTFSQNILQELKSLMNEVATYKSLDLQQYERDNGFEWDSFLSVLYLYEPKRPSTSQDKESIVEQLSQLAVDILLLSLETTIWKQEHIDCLVNQDLLEYLIMLPWNVPLCSRETAKRIIANAAKMRPIQPPSLSSISKTKVARMRWGLKKVKDMRSISHLLSQITI